MKWTHGVVHDKRGKSASAAHAAFGMCSVPNPDSGGSTSAIHSSYFLCTENKLGQRILGTIYGNSFGSKLRSSQ